MHILIFTRLTGHNEEAVFLEGVFDSKKEARKAMKERYEQIISNQGFEREWTWMLDDQAVLESYDMEDVIRLRIFDSENPYGFMNDRGIDWAVMYERNLG